jgi:hypothetical protein
MRHEVAILLLLGISLAGFGLIYLTENIDNHVSESPAQVEKYEHENIHICPNGSIKVTEYNEPMSYTNGIPDNYNVERTICIEDAVKQIIKRLNLSAKYIPEEKRHIDGRLIFSRDSVVKLINKPSSETIDEWYTSLDTIIRMSEDGMIYIDGN